jgi:hypothetical protein
MLLQAQCPTIAARVPERCIHCPRLLPNAGASMMMHMLGTAGTQCLAYACLP